MDVRSILTRKKKGRACDNADVTKNFKSLCAHANSLGSSEHGCMSSTYQLNRLCIQKTSIKEINDDDWRIFRKHLMTHLQRVGRLMKALKILITDMSVFCSAVAVFISEDLSPGKFCMVFLLTTELYG